MEDKIRTFPVDQNDWKFIKEISQMPVHRKILLHGMLAGISMADQRLEKDKIEPKRYH